MNSCNFVGRLTRDPEISTGARSGKSFAKFGIAITRGGQKDENGKPVSDFFDFTAFGTTAEFVEKHFSKGDVIAINGEAQLDTWESDGQKRSKVCFVARNVSFVPGVGRKDAATKDNSVDEPVGAGVGGEEDIPF